MHSMERIWEEHVRLSRRFFVGLGMTGIAASVTPSLAMAENQFAPELKDALAKLESFMTPPDKFQDVSRGEPLPHSLSEDRRKEVGLTRETWQLEVLSDTEHPSRLRKQMTKAEGTAIDFSTLMQIAQTHAVRYAKVMTCLNMGCPLGMGVWEGVPLREVIGLTQPVENVRRVFYYGYHNDKPKQMFRSSLPIGRVLEDPFDLPPVIVCYKLNGEWLTPKRGGPVRIVVPEAYGFKSIKWLSHIVLTNLAVANDTYIDGNNDIDSPMKTFAATLFVPREVISGQQIPVTGYAQVGISGLSKIQVSICPKGSEPENDPYLNTGQWTDATILDPPQPGAWGGELPDSKIPAGTLGFDEAGHPQSWPMCFCKVQWAVLLPGLTSGEYTLRSRTIDEKNHAQPLPRPFRKSGHADIEKFEFVVK